MPRYFFHAEDSENGFFRDNQGRLLPGEREARREAGNVLSEIVRDTLPKDGLWRGLKVIVSTAPGGAPIFETRLHWETEFAAGAPEDE